MTVTALGDGLEEARRLAYDAVGLVAFEGMAFRRDIALRAAQMATVEEGTR
jgi:phosphoribosylamine-glycine ligase